LMCDGFALKGGGAICTPRPPPLPPPMARVSRERACPFGQSEPRHTRRGLERARARTNSARARVRRSRAPRTRPRSLPPLDARGRRVVPACETRRDPTTPLPFERKHRQKPKRESLEVNGVSSSIEPRGREHRANFNLYGNQSLRSANPIYEQSR
jgi:hypothetical protein